MSYTASARQVFYPTVEDSEDSVLRNSVSTSYAVSELRGITGSIDRGKIKNDVILSGAKNLPWCFCLHLNQREILRSAQNDKKRYVPYPQAVEGAISQYQSVAGVGNNSY
jgi:hypothetical protein